MTSAILKRRMGGDKVEMQTLLEQFNKIDHNQQGSIKLAEAIKLIQRICSINRMNQGILKRIIYTIDNFVTFDEFLALLYETEFDNGMTRNTVNHKMVEFLKLLEDYRLKCQESSLYLQAEKVNQKIVQVKDKEMRRHKLNLIMDQRSRVITVNSLQQSKMVDFNTAWDQYMENYEEAAMDSLEVLKAKHLREMQDEEQRVKTFMEAFMRPSKRIIDLKSKEKLLVKQKEYFEAQKIKNIIANLQQKERAQKTAEVNEKIKRRKQKLQKHQQITLMAHLKRIEKDRNEQIKQRELDSEKMIVKLKNMQNQLAQKQSVEIRQTLENLRETLFFSSSKLMMQRKSNFGLVSNDPQKQSSVQEQKKGKEFNIRMNSLHRTRLDDSV